MCLGAALEKQGSLMCLGRLESAMTITGVMVLQTTGLPIPTYLRPVQIQHGWHWPHFLLQVGESPHCSELQFPRWEQ